MTTGHAPRAGRRRVHEATARGGVGAGRAHAKDVRTHARTQGTRKRARAEEQPDQPAIQPRGWSLSRRPSSHGGVDPAGRPGAGGAGGAGDVLLSPGHLLLRQGQGQCGEGARGPQERGGQLAGAAGGLGAPGRGREGLSQPRLPGAEARYLRPAPRGSPRPARGPAPSQRPSPAAAFAFCGHFPLPKPCPPASLCWGVALGRAGLYPPNPGVYPFTCIFAMHGLLP